MSRNNQPKHPGERILFNTRPRFISALESALFRFIVLLLLLFFFTTLIAYAAVVQGYITYLTTIPFVEWFTYGLILDHSFNIFVHTMEFPILEIHMLHTNR